MTPTPQEIDDAVRKARAMRNAHLAGLLSTALKRIDTGLYIAGYIIGRAIGTLFGNRGSKAGNR